jgi:hypothetical protein
LLIGGISLAVLIGDDGHKLSGGESLKKARIRRECGRPADEASGDPSARGDRMTSRPF